MAGKKKASEVVPVPQIVSELQSLQRQRSIVIKSKVMQENRIVAIMAGALGYSSMAEEKERDKKFDEARALIKKINTDEATHPLAEVVKTTYLGIDAFNKAKDDLTKKMEGWVEKLPIRGWVEANEQKGFGLVSCGMVLGEAGDLSNYANPAKLWKRMGCAPYQCERLSKTAMGGTWKRGKEGKLTAEEWTAYGYSPRRRSIMYVVTDCLLKANGDGPYKSRYIEAKIGAFHSHPEWDWTKCTLCKGKPDGCVRCGDTGKKCGRAHLHGMLLAGKLLLKNLWKQWNPDLVKEETPELWQTSQKRMEPVRSMTPVETKPARKRKSKEVVDAVANRCLYT